MNEFKLAKDKELYLILKKTNVDCGIPPEDAVIKTDTHLIVVDGYEVVSYCYMDILGRKEA